MTPDDVEAVVRNLLRTELGVSDDGVTLDTELITNGLLDSVGVVRLASLLERESGIRVPNHEITVENFGTLRRIHDYLSTRLGG